MDRSRLGLGLAMEAYLPRRKSGEIRSMALAHKYPRICQLIFIIYAVVHYAASVFCLFAEVTHLS